MRSSRSRKSLVVGVVIAFSLAALIPAGAAGPAYLTIDLGGTLYENFTWNNASSIRSKVNLTGNTSSTATESAVTVQVYVPENSYQGEYEKAAAYLWARTADSSPNGDTRDAVGVDMRGQIDSGNNYGRAWGGYSEATILADGDGQAIGLEVDVVNNGSDQANNFPTTPTSKTGVSIVAEGAQPSTTALSIYGGHGQKWHKGIYSHQAFLGTAATDSFIELGWNEGTLFRVTPDGQVFLAYDFLPTSDPHIRGKIWRSGNSLMISGG